MADNCAYKAIDGINKSTATISKTIDDAQQNDPDFHSELQGIFNRTSKNMAITVHEYKPDKLLNCSFQNHDFTLERDGNDGFSFGNWYMIVKDKTGAVCCDGWIDDSNSIGALNAMEQACLGAEIEPPKQWPDELLTNRK